MGNKSWVVDFIIFVIVAITVLICLSLGLTYSLFWLKENLTAAEVEENSISCYEFCSEINYNQSVVYHKKCGFLCEDLTCRCFNKDNVTGEEFLVEFIKNKK